MHVLRIAAVRGTAAIAAANTYFQPDEYWQSLEIAHRIVFGYGYRTWEWAREPPIRSVIHPLLFVPVYLFANVTPGGAQAVLIVLHTASFYLLFTSSRTFSNTAEAALVSIALYFWPLTDRGVPRRRFLVALAAAYTAVLVRPTSIVLWAFLGVWHLADMSKRGALPVLKAITDAVLVGAVVLGVGLVADSLYYGRLVFTPATFFIENVVHSVAIFYGTHPWHWYLSQGLPAMLTVATPWVLAGWWNALIGRISARDPGAVQRLAYTALFVVAVFSLLSHKEFRFLQSVLPMLHVCGAIYLASAAPSVTNWSAASRSLPNPLRTLLLAQVPFLIYTLAFHSRGQVAIMGHLHDLASQERVHSIGFMMPCHSTPWQSHLHLPKFASEEPTNSGRLWFVGCPPPQPNDGPMYWDQSDFFYHDPITYIYDRFPHQVDPAFPPSPGEVKKAARVPPERAQFDLGWQHEWPSHLVVFDALLHVKAHNTSVKDILAEKGYTERLRVWNSIFHPDQRRRGSIVVLRHSAA
ncbi:glycosylphosphatidylinositol anchor biosynthesis [Malassezia cuniculi]|uniref:Mannosyltransferase n=1 Tax=Malassezia cuniculi TaxID=948313 RepID=A0AAF0EX15_9BASI|nr:glycosylphosphatidylinositol anchor biosynthesis [Malassezia cuniculi]